MSDYLLWLIDQRLFHLAQARQFDDRINRQIELERGETNEA